jgi:hypothetical protein
VSALSDMERDADERAWLHEQADRAMFYFRTITPVAWASSWRALRYTPEELGRLRWREERDAQRAFERQRDEIVERLREQMGERFGVPEHRPLWKAVARGAA